MTMRIAWEPKSVMVYYREPQPELLRFMPTTAQRVVDLDCADGKFSAKVKDRTGAEVWGISSDEQATRHARTLIDHVLVGAADQRIADLPDAYFDVIICNGVLERFVDPGATLAQLRSKLEPEGAVIAVVPNIRFLPALSQVLFRKDFPQEDFGTFDRTSLRFFTRRSIKRIFRQAGFALQRVEGLNPRYGIPSVLLTVLSLGYFADGLYLQYACVASPEPPKAGVTESG
jgi:2-polyprenyl-3-methyl-5-hydroxy-6-metoxy-1,4-benzoquinol methylase